jgi:hypothetical protein
MAGRARLLNFLPLNYNEIKNNQWLRLTDWDNQISVDWQYKAQPDLVVFFTDFDHIKLQEITKQGLHKLSYYVSLEAELEPIIIKIRSKLETEKIQANIIWSIDEKAQVGTIDKFQGQEAQVVIMSMTTSSAEEMPRHMEFLFSKNRINVALSRARCLAIFIANPDLMAIPCSTPEQMALVNTLCWIKEIG